MKTKAYQDSKLKYELRHMYPRDEKKPSFAEQLRSYEWNGKKELLWRLNRDQLDLVHNLGYYTEPYMFYVHTKLFPDNLRNKYKLLEKLHAARRARKDYVACILSKTDRDMLKRLGVSFSPLKYKISLQRNHK